MQKQANPLLQVLLPPKKEKVLVLAPHPDDEILGCGGLLSYYANQSTDIVVVNLTDGRLGRGLKVSEDEIIKRRNAEFKSSMANLGLINYHCWAFQDGKLGENNEVHDKILTILNSFNPDLILSSSFIDEHPDHRLTAIYLQKALSQYDGELDVLTYEIWTPHTDGFLIDVTDYYDSKLSSLALYQSQIELLDYVKLTQSLESYRGIQLTEVLRNRALLRERISGKKTSYKTSQYAECYKKYTKAEFLRS